MCPLEGNYIRTAEHVVQHKEVLLLLSLHLLDVKEPNGYDESGTIKLRNCWKGYRITQ